MTLFSLTASTFTPARLPKLFQLYLLFPCANDVINWRISTLKIYLMRAGVLIVSSVAIVVVWRFTPWKRSREERVSVWVKAFLHSLNFPSCSAFQVNTEHQGGRNKEGRNRIQLPFPHPPPPSPSGQAVYVTFFFLHRPSTPPPSTHLPSPRRFLPFHTISVFISSYFLLPLKQSFSSYYFSSPTFLFHFFFSVLYLVLSSPFLYSFPYITSLYLTSSQTRPFLLCLSPPLHSYHTLFFFFAFSTSLNLPFISLFFSPVSRPSASFLLPIPPHFPFQRRPKALG